MFLAASFLTCTKLVKEEEQMQRRTAEPFRIKTVEPIPVTTREQRQAAMAKAGYNTFLLKSRDVTIDLLTDSGTSAMSDAQWSAMMVGDEAYAGSRSFDRLSEAIGDVYGYKFCCPTHQGRAVENILSLLKIKPGMTIPGNMYFTTTKVHQERNGGMFRDIVIDEAHDPVSEHPFKGDVDIEKLSALIGEVGAANIPYVSIQATVNMSGGQPISVTNMREVKELCNKHGIPVVLDATRVIENCFFIQEREDGFAHQTIRQILLELTACADICYSSAKKDCLVNIGGFMATNDEEFYCRFTEQVVVFEGLHTYGGLAGRDLEALATGIIESADDHYIASRVNQVRYLGNQLVSAGVPVIRPIGGHAVFLDAKAILPHLPQEVFPAQALSAALYEDSGMRSMERGAVSAGRDNHGNNIFPQLELVRVTIPRRVYTDRHMDVVADSIMQVYSEREKVRGLKIVYEPPVLRFFTARFELV